MTYMRITLCFLWLHDIHATYKQWITIMFLVVIYTYTKSVATIKVQ
jgi:hypothetical protein